MLNARPQDDPFADQREWLTHRYDPGHFLGGTLRPELRLSLGTRAKRMASLWAFASGVALLGSLLVFSFAMRTFLPDPWSVLLGSLSILVGARMWRAAKADVPGETLAVGVEARRLARVAGLVVLGTLLVGIAGAAAVGAAAAVSSALSGHTGLPAGIGALLALALLHRHLQAAGKA